MSLLTLLFNLMHPRIKVFISLKKSYWPQIFVYFECLQKVFFPFNYFLVFLLKLFTFFFSGEPCSLLPSPPSSSPVKGSEPLDGFTAAASWLDVFQPVRSTPAAHHSCVRRTRVWVQNFTTSEPTVCVFSSHLVPSCWGLSPPEGGSTLAQGRFSCDYPLSHWPVRTQEGGDVHKAFVNKISATHYKQKDAILRAPIMPWLR